MFSVWSEGDFNLSELRELALSEDEGKMFEVMETKCVYNPETGVIVDLIGRYKTLYFVGEQLLILPSESLGPPEALVQSILFHPKMRWEWPCHEAAITDEEREKIKNDIREAFAVLAPSMRVEFKSEFG